MHCRQRRRQEEVLPFLDGCCGSNLRTLYEDRILTMLLLYVVLAEAIQIAMMMKRWTNP